MAANTKRIPIKHIRDGAKARYPKKEYCAICDTTELLELHHYTSLTNLLEGWQKKEGIPLNTDEQVLEIRDRFIAEHEYELYTAVAVLCEDHHRRLHAVFGKSPPLSTSKKQERWVLIQKDKHNGIKPEISKPNDVVREGQPGSISNSQERGVFSKLIYGNVSFSSFRSD
jgi:hypothetical protein